MNSATKTASSWCTLTAANLTLLALDCWRNLSVQGFVLLSDEDIGFGDWYRQHLLATHFTQLRREHYPGVVPRNRMRACDALFRYRQTRVGKTRFLPEDNVGFRIKTGTPGEHPFGMWRIYDRVPIYNDTMVQEWLSIVFALILCNRQLHSDGPIRIDLFRIDTADAEPAPVTSGPHTDGYPVTILYCADKHGGGAETTLHDPLTLEVLHRFTLLPGQFVIIRSDMLLHAASDLLPAPDGTGSRAMMVINAT